MSSFLLLQWYLSGLVCLTWMVCLMEGRCLLQLLVCVVRLPGFFSRQHVAFLFSSHLAFSLSVLLVSLLTPCNILWVNIRTIELRTFLCQKLAKQSKLSTKFCFDMVRRSQFCVPYRSKTW